LRVAPHVRTTPLWVLPGSSLGLPAGTPEFEAWLKLEHLQLSGSFKARGMFNRLLSNPIPAAGVIAASGGNAGIATAVAARALGVPAEIYVPGVITPAKRERLATLGATVVIAGDAYADALAACEAASNFCSLSASARCFSAADTLGSGAGCARTRGVCGFITRSAGSEALRAVGSGATGRLRIVSRRWAARSRRCISLSTASWRRRRSCTSRRSRRAVSTHDVTTKLFWQSRSRDTKADCAAARSLLMRARSSASVPTPAPRAHGAAQASSSRVAWHQPMRFM